MLPVTPTVDFAGTLAFLLAALGYDTYEVLAGGEDGTVPGSP